MELTLFNTEIDYQGQDLHMLRNNEEFPLDLFFNPELLGLSYIFRLNGEHTNTDYIPNNALHRFKLLNSVPENWIPFIATRQVPDQHGNYDVLVQRASMLRYVDDNYTNEVIRPRTDILSIGIPENQPYFIHEEVVGRSGFVVSSHFQRARWYDGKVFTWLGRTVREGRGEGNSGLKFDTLVDKESDL